MRFKSPAQRRAVFANINRFSNDHEYSNDYEYDYENVALKKYGKEMKEVPVKKGGRDRDVYLLNEEKVLKVAKSPEGLMQNTVEGDAGLDIVPNVSETGSDYVLVERADRNDPRSMRFLKPLREYHQVQIEHHPSELQGDLEALDTEYGTDTLNILSYDVNWRDFTAPRNWGWKNDMPKLIDPGALSQSVLNKVEPGDPTRKEWRLILDERRRARKDLGLDSKFSNEHISGRDLDKVFIRTFNNSEIDGKVVGFRYKLRSDPFGDKGFYTREEAEEIFKKMHDKTGTE